MWIADQWRLWKNRRAYNKNRKNAPGTLDEAIQRLHNDIESGKMPDGKDWLASPEDEAMSNVHHGFGMWLRNNWGMWDKKSPLHLHFVNIHQIWHADDMSGIILTTFHRRANERPVKIHEQIEKYKSHWRKHGIEGVPEHHFEE